MVSSVTDTDPQQGGKKGKDKTKDVMVLMEDRLTEFNSTISTLTDRVEDMNKRIEELKSIGNLDELSGEMQTTMNSVVATVNREVQAL